MSTKRQDDDSTCKILKIRTGPTRPRMLETRLPSPPPSPSFPCASLSYIKKQRKHGDHRRRKGGKRFQRVSCNVREECTGRPHGGGVSDRTNDSTPSRKGRTVNGLTTTASNKRVRHYLPATRTYTYKKKKNGCKLQKQGYRWGRGQGQGGSSSVRPSRLNTEDASLSRRSERQGWRGERTVCRAPTTSLQTGN